MATEMLSYSQLGGRLHCSPEAQGAGQATALTTSEGERWQSAGVRRFERDQP